MPEPEVVEATTDEVLIPAREVQRSVLPADNKPVWDALAFNPAESVWVSLLGGGVVGYVWTEKLHRPGGMIGGDFLVVHQIAVMPVHQGAGIGTALLRHVAEHAEADVELWLKPLEGETKERLVTYYRKRGFTRSVEQGYIAGLAADVLVAVDAFS